MRCQACGHDNLDDSQFCVLCGVSLSVSRPAEAGTDSSGLPTVSFISAIRLGFSNYFRFSGRATRAEYWWWALFIVVVFVALTVVDGFMGASGRSRVLNSLFALAVIIPFLALSSRRLHDINRSSWWILLFIYIFPNAYAVFALALVVSIAAGISVGITGFIVPFSVGFLLIISVPAWWIRWMVRQGCAGSNKYGSDPRHAISQQP